MHGSIVGQLVLALVNLQLQFSQHCDTHVLTAVYTRERTHIRHVHT